MNAILARPSLNSTLLLRLPQNNHHHFLRLTPSLSFFLS